MPQPVPVACCAFALLLGGTPSTWGADGYLRVGVASQSAPTEPMPARLVFYHVESGQYVQTFATEEGTRGNRFGRNTWPSFTLQGVHHPRRYLSYRLPEGTYRVTAGRGMSWYPGTAEAVVAAGATTTLRLVLQRVVDTEARGWFAGDGHVHVEHGGGAETPTNEWFRLWGEAAGLNWLSLSQEYLGAGTVDLAAQQAYVRSLSNATFQCWLGGERPKSALGHLAAVLPDQNPWQILDEPPYYVGAEQVRRAGGVTYPVHVDRLFPGGDTSSFKYNNFTSIP